MSPAASARGRNPTNLAVLCVLAGTGIALGCGGGSQQVEALPPPPERGTRATLAGPLCGEAICTCREGDDDAGRAEDGTKRYEIKLGPAEHEMWATVGTMLLYKSRERATDCFYLDLRPGIYEVAVRGASDEAVGFQAAISEQGGEGETTWWYDTFRFACGAPGPCDRAALDEFTRSTQGKRGKLDPCGSTKVKEIGWHSGRMPDHGSPTDLRVAMKLHVYAFDPGQPPGSAACAGNPGNQ
jgi:hypothetical protein